MPGEVAIGLECTSFHVPLDAHPIIQGLQWKVNVFRRLQLDHRQTPAMVESQKIEHSPVGGSECGDLAVHRHWKQAGVDSLDVTPHLGFEPRLGISPIQGMAMVGCVGRTKL